MDEKRKGKSGGPKEKNPNLQDLRDLTPEERKRFAAAGGKASVLARRMKKTFRRIAAEILACTPPKEVAKEIAKQLPEVPVEEIDNKTVIVYKQLEQAMKGNTRSFKVLFDVSGEKQEEDFAETEPIEIRIVE